MSDEHRTDEQAQVDDLPQPASGEADGAVVRGGALNTYVSKLQGEKQGGAGGGTASITDGTSNTIMFAEKHV